MANEKFRNDHVITKITKHFLLQKISSHTVTNEKPKP